MPRAGLMGRVSGMKRGLVATGVAALLLLSGCTGMQEQETVAVASNAPAGTTAATPLVPVETEAPAAPVEVTTAPPKQNKAGDVLVGIQLTVASYGVEVMADQIESASNYACDQLSAGVPEDQIVALTGDIPEGANRDLVQLARDSYCGIR